MGSTMSELKIYFYPRDLPEELEEAHRAQVDAECFLARVRKAARKNLCEPLERVGDSAWAHDRAEQQAAAAYEANPTQENRLRWDDARRRSASSWWAQFCVALDQVITAQQGKSGCRR